MKLNSAQWAWMFATFAFVAIVFLDVADVLALPNTVLILGALLLGLVGRAVGPSMAELKRANRRG